MAHIAADLLNDGHVEFMDLTGRFQSIDKGAWIQHAVNRVNPPG